MKVKVSKIVPKGYIGITLWPFGIFVSEVKWLTVQWLLNHEGTHWKQQKETAVVGGIISLITGGLLMAFGVFSWWMLLLLLFPFLLFYLEYVIEWFIKLFIHGGQSYQNLGAEREANLYEHDDTYLSRRKLFAHIKYIFKKP